MGAKKTGCCVVPSPLRHLMSRMLMTLKHASNFEDVNNFGEGLVVLRRVSSRSGVDLPVVVRKFE